MKKINIKIKDNLSPEKEVLEIAKQLSKNTLLLGNSTALIGDNIEVQHLKTVIEVERIPNEPLMCVCPVCETNFDKSIGKKLYHNYGGKGKTMFLCSSECKDYVSSFMPSNRKTRKPALLF